MAGNSNSGKGLHSSKLMIDNLGAKCVNFLYNNFHKFSLEKKIQVSLEVVKKLMPQINENKNSGTIVFRIENPGTLINEEEFASTNSIQRN